MIGRQPFGQRRKTGAERGREARGDVNAAIPTADHRITGEGCRYAGRGDRRPRVDNRIRHLGVPEIARQQGANAAQKSVALVAGEQIANLGAGAKAPDGAPWLVFCHEWVQIGDGGMCALRLTTDLKAASDDPITLFHASAAPWAARFENRDVGQLGYGIVTDGPFLFRAQDGALLMLWSSLGKEGYAMGVARAASGRVTGPWEQQAEPVFAKDGGHGMLFRTFDGRLMMTLHCPNRTPDERPVFLPVEETGATLRRV